MNNLKHFFRIMSKINYDAIFYDSIQEQNIPFKQIFPPGTYSIVGNSPIILENKNGKTIDNSDYVIRFNNYKTEGYESYTGKRTTMWITGAGVQTSSDIQNIDAKKFLVIPRNMRFKEKKMQFYNKYKKTEFIVLHNDFLLKLISSLVGGVPTTGMIMLLLLSAKYKTINTFGFSFGAFNNKYHYYPDSVVIDVGHRWNKEKQIYALLYRIGIINNNKHTLISKDTDDKLEELKQIME